MSEAIHGFLMFLVLAAFWVTPIVLGVKVARKKSRSPHWMWFGVHPIGGWIALGVLTSVPHLKECPRCAEKIKAHANLCPYCRTPLTDPMHIQSSDAAGAEEQTQGPSHQGAKIKSALRTSLTIARVVTLVLCFWLVLVYAIVYSTAILKGDIRGFLVGLSGSLFKEPSVIILLTISLLTLIAVVAGEKWYFNKFSPKPSSAAVVNLAIITLASVMLETIAVYGLVLGFMFGPKSASLSLLLLLSTMIGGILIFPSSANWSRISSQGNGTETSIAKAPLA